jgi:hypothetical protein
LQEKPERKTVSRGSKDFALLKGFEVVAHHPCLREGNLR